MSRPTERTENMTDYSDKLMARAIYVLQQRDEHKALNLLSSCSGIIGEYDGNGSGPEPILITLIGSIALCNALNSTEKTAYNDRTPIDPTGRAIWSAFNEAHSDTATGPQGTVTLFGQLQIPEVGDNWKNLIEEKTTKELKIPQNSIFGAPISDPKRYCNVFMIMPFAEKFQPVYENHIRPVVQGLGHTIRRGDDFFGKTSVMTDIWSAINNAKLVIAECTGRNPNVFYELGIAHSLDKAVIMLTQNIEDIPFDIRHLRVIEYKYTPPGMVKFKVALKTAISNLMEE